MTIIRKYFRKAVGQTVPANFAPANSEIALKRQNTFFQHYEQRLMTDPDASGFPISFPSVLAAGSPIYRDSQTAGNDPTFPDILTTDVLFDGFDATSGVPIGLQLTVPPASIIPGSYMLEWGYMWNGNSTTSDFVGAIFDLNDPGGPLIPPHRQEPKDASGVLGDTGANQFMSFRSPIINYSPNNVTGIDLLVRVGTSNVDNQVSVGYGFIQLTRVVPSG